MILIPNASYVKKITSLGSQGAPGGPKNLLEKINTKIISGSVCKKEFHKMKKIKIIFVPGVPKML